jgi:hypothetical protein
MIDLTKPIEVDGRPVSVLGTWNSLKPDMANACFILQNDRPAILWDNGNVSQIENAKSKVTNQSPPNIVSEGDEVARLCGSDGLKLKYVVRCIDGEFLWCKRVGYDSYDSFHFSRVLLSGLPIDGVKQ